MKQSVTVHIPHDWLEGMPEEQLLLEHIVRLGIHQYKLERAFQLYRDGVGSLGYIAEQLGLKKQILIHEARLHNIEPEFSEQTVQEELAE
jgi:hypothetical protein